MAALSRAETDMAAKKSSPVMDFVTDYLKKQRDATFADVRDAAAKKRLTVYPIVYGRAADSGALAFRPERQVGGGHSPSTTSVPGRPFRALDNEDFYERPHGYPSCSCSLAGRATKNTSLCVLCG